MAMTALLGACGGGEQKPSSAASDTSPASQGRDTGRVLDEVRVGLPGSLSNLYPGVESGILNYYVAALTMEGLLSVDSPASCSLRSRGGGRPRIPGRTCSRFARTRRSRMARR